MPAAAFTNTNEQVVSGVTLIDGELTLDFAPLVGKAQRVKLLLNDFNAPDARPARAYSFNAPPDNGITDEAQTETGSIAFELQGVAAGDYLARVQVDGAVSALQRENDNNSPAFNQFNGPKATIA